MVDRGLLPRTSTAQGILSVANIALVTLGKVSALYSAQCAISFAPSGSDCELFVLRVRQSWVRDETLSEYCKVTPGGVSKRTFTFLLWSSRFNKLVTSLAAWKISPYCCRCGERQRPSPKPRRTEVGLLAKRATAALTKAKENIILPCVHVLNLLLSSYWPCKN